MPAEADEKCAFSKGIAGAGFAASTKPALSLIRFKSSFSSLAVRAAWHASRRRASCRHGVSFVADQSRISSIAPKLAPRSNTTRLYVQAIHNFAELMKVSFLLHRIGPSPQKPRYLVDPLKWVIESLFDQRLNHCIARD